jgi:hypothetical protein
MADRGVMKRTAGQRGESSFTGDGDSVYGARSCSRKIQDCLQKRLSPAK